MESSSQYFFFPQNIEICGRLVGLSRVCKAQPALSPDSIRLKLRNSVSTNGELPQSSTMVVAVASLASEQLSLAVNLLWGPF